MTEQENKVATSMVTIKKGRLELRVPKDELIEVSETHDGIAFNFKRGLQLYQIENFMPVHIKQLISNSINTFGGKNIIVDLDNPKQPVRVEMD